MPINGDEINEDEEVTTLLSQQAKLKRNFKRRATAYNEWLENNNHIEIGGIKNECNECKQ